MLCNWPVVGDQCMLHWLANLAWLTKTIQLAKKSLGQKKRSITHGQGYYRQEPTAQQIIKQLLSQTE